ncbi:hypothetical protein FS935_10010 [Metabacillus litoralis]|uniref:Uncharacterized protein n=1 Tax=Metabacillus litoralis TaxID=152268 RepID=A0A5C6W5W8_9BACI|nr:MULTISPECIES: hypothetical protein [Metabacillus]MBM7605415.1 prefoldin subunit 5 [Metabacillus crassostreae]TXC91221.1 hypothetical protein FS935_10010 [Metabacillus litoralis]
MKKNARGYVQDSYSALENAKNSLQQALQTVEKDSNRERIQSSLQSVESALDQCGQTVNVLEEV